MKSAPLVFLGVLTAVAASWWGLVAAPRLQIGGATALVPKGADQPYPPMRPGLALQGEELFRSEGCFYCHTRLVRPAGFGPDLALGWGRRRSVAQDYLRDDPVLTGVQRIGPDLANLGSRMGAGDTNQAPSSRKYHLLHLYQPRSLMPGSIMPAYPYLFELREIRGEPSPDALPLSGAFAPPAGHEVVPTPAAEALVSYLFSLRADVSLPEAPILEPSTNGPPAITNAPSATTNAPAATTNAPAATNRPATAPVP